LDALVAIGERRLREGALAVEPAELRVAEGEDARGDDGVGGAGAGAAGRLDGAEERRRGRRRHGRGGGRRRRDRCAASAEGDAAGAEPEHPEALHRETAAMTARAPAATSSDVVSKESERRTTAASWGAPMASRTWLRALPWQAAPAEAMMPAASSAGSGGSRRAGEAMVGICGTRGGPAPRRTALGTAAWISSQRRSRSLPTRPVSPR